jgi:NHL repeat
VVTTLAGLAGSSGSADGTGSDARFYLPDGVAVDSAGNVYVADTFNALIRKVTPGGVVTTLGGVAGRLPLAGGWESYGGSADGTGSDARFAGPSGVAVDGAGNVYVADSGNNTIRLGRPACPDAPTIDLVTGPVGQARQLDTSPQTAVAWQWRLVRIPATSALASWTANVRNPTFTPDVADLFIFRLTATNAAGAIAIRTLAFTALPALSPVSQTVEIGSSACFRVGAPNTVPGTIYQWYFNGSPLSGATGASLAPTNVQPAQGGAYTVVISNASGAVTSAPASLAVIAPVQRGTVATIYLAAEIGTSLHLEYTDAFGPGNTWRPLSDFAVTNAPQICLDLSGPLAAQRFYRARQANATAAPPRLDLSLATAIALTGALGKSVRIDYINAVGPTDAWVALATVTLTNSPQLAFDLTAFRQAPRLYRLVPLP